MTDINQLLDQLGIESTEGRQAVQAQILSYTFERAVVLLGEQGNLTDEDKGLLNHALAGEQVNDEEIAKVFESPERQKLVAQAMAEAIELAAKAAHEAK